MSQTRAAFLVFISFLSLVAVWSLAPRISVLEVGAIRATSTSFIVPLSELISISGPSTSTSFKLNSAGGQQATGISTSTSFKAWAGILYSIFGEATSTPTITVSGVVYKDEGITRTTSTIKLVVNGTDAYTGATDAAGLYTLTGVTEPSSGDILTVWMNNDGGGNGLGASVNRYSGTGDVTNFHIYKDYLITRYDDAGPLTNTNIGLCDSATGSACADSDLHFNEASGALTVQNDWGLYLWGGSTFTPGGAVTLLNTALPTKTPAYVQSVTEYTSDGILAYSSANTPGNLLIAVVSGSGTAEPTISDSVSNSWTALPRLLGGGGGTAFTLKLFYAIAASSTANTVTIASLPGDVGMSIYEYSNVDAVSPLDNSTSTAAQVADGVTTTPTLAMVTQTRDLLFLAFADESTNNTFTAGSGFTLRENTTNHVDAQEEGVFNPGSQAASFTLGTSVNTWGLYLAAFEAAHYPGGDIVWASSTSVISIGNNDLSVGGDWRNEKAGTFSNGSTHTTTFTATTTGFTIDTGGQSFRRLTFNGASGGWYPIRNNMTVGASAINSNNLTMTAGILSNEYSTSSITVTNGNAAGTGGVISLTNSTFTMMLVGTTTANFGQTSGSDWAFKDLVFTNASNTATTFQFTTLTSGSGNIGVTNNLQVLSSPTVGNTMALNAGDRTWTLSGNDGIPFELSATGGSVSFDSSSSTFVYTGSNTGGNTTMASTTYWNLTVNNGAGETYVFGTNTLVNNNFQFTGFGDTVDTTGINLTVNNNFIQTNGTFSGTGNITVKGGIQFGASAVLNLTGGTFEHLISASTTIQTQVPLLASITFNNLKMNNSASTARTSVFSMIGPNGFTVTNDWTIGDNSSSTYILSLGGANPVVTMDVNNDFNLLTDGKLDAATSQISIARNLTATGVIAPASSTFTFDTTVTSTITGGTSLPVYFNNLRTVTANKPLVFATSTPYFEVAGLLTLTGTAGNPVTVQSNSSGTQWKINHQGTELTQYASVKDSGCVATSTYITINYADSIDRGNNGFCWAFPSLSFTISPLSVSLTLNDTNTFTANATNTLTVSTNGEFGYQVSAHEDALMTRLGGAETIANWTGTNAVPTTWTTSCIGSATCGFGYSTDDVDLTQFSSTKFAGFTTSTPGDVVASASGRVTSDATIMTYRSSVNLTQRPGDYQTTVRYIVAPQF